MCICDLSVSHLTNKNYQLNKLHSSCAIKRKINTVNQVKSSHEILST